MAILPLHTNSIVYRVGNGGSDSNNGLTHATRFATLAHAVSQMRQGFADRVLIAEGSVLNEPIPWLGLSQRDGISATYLSVIGSYDPLDADNQAKWDKGHQRNARPKLTQTAQITSGGGPRFFAIRGLDVDPGNIPNQNIGIVSYNNTSATSVSYFLFENNVCRYTALGIDQTPASGDVVNDFIGDHCIIRGNSFYGMWTNASDGRTGGLYLAGVKNSTNEYNAYWHCGWKIGASRSDDPTVGGATVFSHSWYTQTNSEDNIIRGNLTSQGGGDGGNCRGSCLTYSRNLSLRNPAAFGPGGGPTYNVDRPQGTWFDLGYNVALNAENQNAGHELGWGISSLNGLPDRSHRVHHNLLLLSDISAQGTALGWQNGASYPQPSFAEFDHNVMVGWVTGPGSVFNFISGPYPQWQHATNDYNIWDGATSGTNLSNAGYSFPNPLTEQGVYDALGYADFNAFITDCVNHPEQKKWLQAIDMLLAGYGIVEQTDFTAPVLSAPTRTVVDGANATIGATTNNGNGRLFYVVTTSPTPPLAAQIKMGLKNNTQAAELAGVLPITSAGAKTINVVLADPGTYYAHFCHEDTECNKSNVVSTASLVMVGIPTLFADSLPLTHPDWTVNPAKTNVTRTASTESWIKARSNQAKDNMSVIVTIDARIGGAWGGVMLGWDDGSTNGLWPGQTQDGRDIGFWSDGRVMIGGGEAATFEPFIVGVPYKFDKAEKVFTLSKSNGAGGWIQLWTEDFALSSGWGAPGTYTVPIMEPCYFTVTVGGFDAEGTSVTADWSGA
jgi:hypothetical protein